MSAFVLLGRNRATGKLYEIEVDANGVVKTDAVISAGDAIGILDTADDRINPSTEETADDSNDKLGTIKDEITSLDGKVPADPAKESGKLTTIDSTLTALNAKVPASPATDRATAGAPFSTRLSDGTSFYNATTPSDTQPISAASLPLPSGAATEATLASIKDTAGIKKITDALPAGTNNIGDVDVLTIPGVAGDVAHDAVDSGNPLKVGGKARQTNPTAVADADRVDAMFDDVGRLCVVQGGVRDLVTDNNITLSSTTETTLLPAAGAGVFLDLTMLVLSNTSATGVRVDIRDATAGTILFSVFLAASGGGAVIPFNTAKKQTTANNNWTAQLSAAVTDVRVYAQAVKNV